MDFRQTLLVFISLFSLTGFSQTTNQWEEAFRQWVEAENMESSSLEELYDILSERVEQPINLNQATREELEQLPFLTAQQVEQLLEYTDRYGPIRSFGELQMLTAFDTERRQLLMYFTYVGESAFKDNRLRLDSVIRHGKQQLLLTGKIPLYTRKGDDSDYLGQRYRHTFRYQFNYHDCVKFGVTGAQDPGEPFFANQNRWGYDHYSYYLQIKDVGRIQNLCLGMYRVQLGMGLIINGGFYLGKLATLQSMGRSTAILRPHSSRSTEGYLQGVATTIRLHRNWELTAFASYRPLDATLNKDSTARTLYYSNYHRTTTEMAKKNNTHEIDLGGSIGWRKGTLYAHANILYTRLDRRLIPQKENAPYRCYAAEGKDFLNMSVDYGYTNVKFSFSGETAVNRQGALATIHQLSYRLSPAFSLMTLHRYYDKRYTALRSQSFSEGSGIQNEHGIYFGLTWQPSNKHTINWYADYTHFAWKRYQVSMPSDAFDTMISARTLFNSKWKLEGRYRLHIRQKDNTEKTMLSNYIEHRAHLRLYYDTTFGLSLQTQFDGISVSFREHARGWMTSEQASYQWRWLQLSANAVYFHTDNYESRLYLYERSVLYNFSSLMLYGKGLRYALMVRTDIGKHLLLIAKIGVTNYFDRARISSGLQEISGSSMAEVDMQVRWKF
jgi:hypothetical protein